MQIHARPTRAQPTAMRFAILFEMDVVMLLTPLAPFDTDHHARE